MTSLPPPNPAEGFDFPPRIKSNIRGGAGAGRGDVPHIQFPSYPREEEPRNYASEAIQSKDKKMTAIFPRGNTPDSERKFSTAKEEPYPRQEIKKVRKTKEVSKSPGKPGEPVNKYQEPEDYKKSQEKYKMSQEKDATPPYGIKRPKL